MASESLYASPVVVHRYAITLWGSICWGYVSIIPAKENAARTESGTAKPKGKKRSKGILLNPRKQRQLQPEQRRLTKGDERKASREWGRSKGVSDQSDEYRGVLCRVYRRALDGWNGERPGSCALAGGLFGALAD